MQTLLITSIDTEIPVFVVIWLLLIVFSGLISASKSAFTLILSKDSKAKDIEMRKGQKRLLDHPEKLMATILIANSFANIGFVVISLLLSRSLLTFNLSEGWKLLIEIIIITLVILLFGEIIPRIYAEKRPYKFVRIMTYPLFILGRLFSPLTNLVVYATSIFSKQVKKEHKISLDELSQAIEIATDEVDEERDMLEGIVRFANINTSEVMHSRVDVVAADINTDFDELKDIIIESNFSRIPIYAETFDDIRGVLYVKDLLPYLSEKKDFAWQPLIRKPYFVPSSKKINDLLQEFQQKKMHMAIVIDEYGGTSGIITLEDILEEIVGDISDENDEVEKWHKIENNGSYIFEGKTPIEVFEKIMNIEQDSLLNEEMEIDTLAGLILEIQGVFPELEETILYKGFTFIPIEINERRIKQIRVMSNEPLLSS